MLKPRYFTIIAIVPIVVAVIYGNCRKITEEDLNNLQEEIAKVVPFMDEGKGEGPPIFVVVSEKDDLVGGVRRVIVKLEQNPFSSWSAVVPCDESGITVGTKVKLQRVKYSSTNDNMQVYGDDYHTDLLVAERIDPNSVKASP